MRGGDASFAKPARNSRIAKPLGRRTTPTKSTATTENKVVVQASERMKYP